MSAESGPAVFLPGRFLHLFVYMLPFIRNIFLLNESPNNWHPNNRFRVRHQWH